MMKWLKRARDNRQDETAILFGAPYLSQVEELSQLLRSDYSAKRINRGHA